MNMLKKRSVMIAIAVIALMTLTAGVAAATASSAKFSAVGSVAAAGLDLGSSVESEFDIDGSKIKSITITTVGEAVVGSIDLITRCTEDDKLSGTVCDDLDDLLAPSGVFSIHTSTAVLKVKRQEHLYAPQFGIPIPVVSGTLKGELGGVLLINASGDTLVGTADLKIKSTGLSSYACLIGIGTSTSGPLWGAIGACQADPGPNNLALIHPTFGYLFDPDGGPVLVPLELHVLDTGVFEVVGVTTDVEINGNLSVSVDSSPLMGTTGRILITKGEVTFFD